MPTTNPFRSRTHVLPAKSHTVSTWDSQPSPTTCDQPITQSSNRNHQDPKSEQLEIVKQISHFVLLVIVWLPSFRHFKNTCGSIFAQVRQVKMYCMNRTTETNNVTRHARCPWLSWDFILDCKLWKIMEQFLKQWQTTPSDECFFLDLLGLLSLERHKNDRIQTGLSIGTWLLEQYFWL